MVVKACEKDINEIVKMALKVFEGSKEEELIEEFNDLFMKEDFVVFLKKDNDNIIGFAQCQLRRDYVEGCDYSPVCYLEGIYIEEEYRLKGYAKELLDHCSQWGKQHNCIEFASDCEITNFTSYMFHIKCGFSEMNRVICFKKKL